MLRVAGCCISLILFLFMIAGVPLPAHTAQHYRVLVVMSYGPPEVNPWCQEVKEGIESVLGSNSIIDYFYMDTKVNYERGNEKAAEAYELFQASEYDGVIAVDDNAQSMFVVPYLKDKTSVPVMFAGVNAKPEQYGYPASNVSGVIERGHLRESIALLKQLSAETKSVGFITKESPSGRALKDQVATEASTYNATLCEFALVKNIQEILVNDSLADCDAFFVESTEGILGGDQKPVDLKKLIAFLKSNFFKPVIGANSYHVKSGALCAVVKTGQEQGEGAADKLLEAMEGKSIAEIPISKNYKGTRYINVSSLEMLGLTPPPLTLIGAKLVKTSE